MKSHGSRKFYHLPDTPPSSECGNEEFLSPGRSSKKFRSKSAHFRGSTRDLMQMIDHNIIGRDTTFQGPFGPRRSVYMDHTASGQSLRCIEGFVTDNVLPYYGNTHTTTTLTSSQTTMYRHEAKDIVRNSVGASEHDAVIFCGSGATGAVHKLVQALAGDQEKPKPVVIVGPYEHHSNLLPWRDVGAKMIYIPETADGLFDIDFLKRSLEEVVADETNKGRLLIGSFSAASNITGIVTDDVAVTILMHRYGGLALWDYSAAAAHVQIVMNSVVASSEDEGLAKKDALYFSGHKFVGGPQTPGVLVAKKSIFENVTAPHGSGGGAVFFVTANSHRYLKNTEYREEGGTPAIVESIRLGLVFRLKETVGNQNIVSQEAMYAKQALEAWKNIPEIRILGNNGHPRLPIISFLIENTETGYYLHYNYVVALLNDLFGIQTRGGCACAGPYGQALLGIDLELAQEYENLLLEDSRLDRDHLRRFMESSPYEIFRPGFTRLSIPFYASMAEVEFVIEAVKLVAQYGWKLLPLYTFNPETGEFHHHANHMLHHRKWLSWASFDSDGIHCKERVRNNSEDCVNYKECLEQAKNILTNAHNMSKRRSLPDQSLLFDEKYKRFKWFLLPSEAQGLINYNGTGYCASSSSTPKPFTVRQHEVVSDENEAQTTSKAEDGSSASQLSLPMQLKKSCWSLDHRIKITANKVVDHENRNENSTGSELNISSNDNESENEFLVPGTTVVGPSICFSIETGDTIAPSISHLCSGNGEPVLDPRRSSFDMEENPVIKDSREIRETCSRFSRQDTLTVTDDVYFQPISLSSPVSEIISQALELENKCNSVFDSNLSAQHNGSNQFSVTPDPICSSAIPLSPVQLPYTNLNNEINCSQPLTAQVDQFSHNCSYPSTGNGFGSLQTQCAVVSPHCQPYQDINNHFTYNTSPVPPVYSPYYDQSIMNPAMQQMNAVPDVNQYQSSQPIPNLSPNCNMMYSPQPPISSYSPIPNQTCMMTVNETMTFNHGTTVDYSQCNWPNNNNAISSVNNQCYAPPQQLNSYPTPIQQSMDYGYQGSYPSTPISPQVPFGSPTLATNQYTQCPMSSVEQQQQQQQMNELETELVNVAMRRVTSELANELKSEIRGVISQVEQGMDPDGIRERASSFTAKDKTIEGLRTRARTLSGQVLNGSLKKTVSFEGKFKGSPDECSPHNLSRSSSGSSEASDSRDGSVEMQIQQKSTAASAISKQSDLTVDKVEANHTCTGSHTITESTDLPAQPTCCANNNRKSIPGSERLSSEVEAEKVEINSAGVSAKWHCPPKYILKTTLTALKDFSMLEDGDRVLVCLSGGKDSLSLLHTLKQVQYNLKRNGISFTFGAVTVDPGSSSYDPRPLIPYLKALGVPYFYEEQEIMPAALDKGAEEVTSICSYCSRMKRGRIYACARRNGYNVVAMGQHLDDLTESFFMSVFHNGLLRTMKACYTVKEGDLRVIRPLVNTREKSLRDFAESRRLPIIPENCPACFDAPTERHRIKQLLAQQEILFPKLYVSLRSAIQPLMAVKKTGLETKENVDKSLIDIKRVVSDEDECI